MENTHVIEFSNDQELLEKINQVLDLYKKIPVKDRGHEEEPAIEPVQENKKNLPSRLTRVSKSDDGQSLINEK